MAGLSTGTTATTAQANEVCIGCIGFTVSDSFVSPTNSFTEITEASGAPDLVVLERIVSATGTYGTTVSFQALFRCNMLYVVLSQHLKRLAAQDLT